MIEYFFKVVLISSLLLGFYSLLLQKERMFRFNRFYLLASLVLSLTIPLLLITLPGDKVYDIPVKEWEQSVISIPLNNTETEKQNIQEELYQVNTIRSDSDSGKVQSNNQGIFNGNKPEGIKWELWLTGIYMIVALAFVLRFMVNFFNILRKVSKNKKIGYDGIFLVIIEQKEQLHSFLNYIFIPRQNLKENFSRKELLNHEMAHVKQKHSLDILLVEIIKSVFWFNPAFYLYKRVIQLNHEFLADEAVLKEKTDIHEYQKLIVDSLQVTRTIPMVSNFNYIQTKKRLLMMTKKTNAIRVYMLQFFSIPLVLIFIFIFSNKSYAQKEKVKFLTPQEKEKLQKALKVEDISMYLRDTISAEASNSYVDTLTIDNKVYIVSSSRENLEQLFKKEEVGLKNVSKDDLNKIFKEVEFKDVEKIFDIRELDEHALIVLSKPVNESELRKQTEDKVKKAMELTDYYNSAEYKQKIQNWEAEGRKVAEYYNSKEWKNKMKKIEQEEKDRIELSQKLQKKGEQIQKKAEKLAEKMEEKRRKTENLTRNVSDISSYDYYDATDREEFKEEMKKFKEEMKEFKKEMMNLKNTL